MITCQKCRALLEPGTRECPYCQTDQRHHLAPSESEDAEKTTRFGFWTLGLIVGIYFLMVVVDPARGEPGTARFQPSGLVQEMFGAAHPVLVRDCGQIWRLLASMFLHVDLIHLVFNAIALLILIPIAAGAFGVHRTVCLYFASGLCGAVLSQINDAGGVGASGALCGLIGACGVYGRRRGGMFGDALLRRMIGWAVFIAIYGIAMPGIDNAGHLGGFLGGAALGWPASGARARGGRTDRAWTFAARSMVVGALLVAVVFWAPYAMRILERRDLDLYWRHADRTLRAVAEALHTGDVEDLPADFPEEGPRGTDAVRDAIRTALKLARQHDRGTGAALARASDALSDWSSTLFCSHCLVP